MPDRLYLSCRVAGFSANNQLRHFATLLRKFPFSRLEPEFALRIYDTERVEPAVFERYYAGLEEFDTMMNDARTYAGAQLGFEVDAHWDLWQWDTDWALRPTRVVLNCFGPEFDSPSGENFLVEFGLEDQFLPPESGASATSHQVSHHRFVRENVQSLLKFVHDVDNAMAPELRRLWTDAGEDAEGENFAIRLQRALELTQ